MFEQTKPAQTNSCPPRERKKPLLRVFKVRTICGEKVDDIEVTAHLVFDNSSTGEGLIFRRYYDDDVRTEQVAKFNNWERFLETAIIKEDE